GRRAEMNNKTLKALSQTTGKKGVDRALLIETLEAGLASAVRKKHGATAGVEGKFSNDNGSTTANTKNTLSETVEDPALQMTLQEARPLQPSAKVGDVIVMPLS